MNSHICIVPGKHKVNSTGIWADASKAHPSPPLSQSPTAVFLILVVFCWNLSDVLHLFPFLFFYWTHSHSFFTFFVTFFAGRGEINMGKWYKWAWNFQGRPLATSWVRSISKFIIGLVGLAHRKPPWEVSLMAFQSRTDEQSLPPSTLTCF